MPSFSYRAKDEFGRNVSGTLIVPNLEEVEKVMVQRGLLLVLAKEEASGSFFQRFRGSDRETLLFTIQMATALQSGLPLTQILDDMIEEGTQKNFRQILSDVKMNIEAGNSLASSLNLYPNYFSEVYCIIVDTGEQSGKLDMIFNDLVNLLEWETDLKKQIRKALRFPLTMGIMLTGLATIVLKVVIPNFADLFNSTGTKLPGPTLFLLAASEFLDDYGFIVLGLAIASFFAVRAYYKTEQGHYQLDEFRLKIPFFGVLSQKIAMSRFAHFWQILFESGVDLSLTLKFVARVVQNRKIENGILVARDEIINGRSMAEAFQEAHMFPGLVIRMIRLGESTGALGNSLGKVSSYYDREVPEAIDAMLAAMQPVIMVIMAGILIVVALAIVLPMFGMMDAIH